MGGEPPLWGGGRVGWRGGFLLPSGVVVVAVSRAKGCLNSLGVAVSRALLKGACPEGRTQKFSFTSSSSCGGCFQALGAVYLILCQPKAGMRTPSGGRLPPADRQVKKRKTLKTLKTLKNGGGQGRGTEHIKLRGWKGLYFQGWSLYWVACAEVSVISHRVAGCIAVLP